MTEIVLNTFDIENIYFQEELILVKCSCLPCFHSTDYIGGNYSLLLLVPKIIYDVDKFVFSSFADNKFNFLCAVLVKKKAKCQH